MPLAGAQNIGDLTTGRILTAAREDFATGAQGGAPPVAHRPVQARRFGDIMLDVIGPLEPSHDGMKYISLLIQRYFHALVADRLA